MRIVIASSNNGKIREIEQICAGLDIQFLHLGSLPNAPKTVEDGDTYQENATKKALQIACFSNLVALGEDSGLEVDALGGKPGIFSARYAGETASDDDNNRKLLHDLKNTPFEKRTARYRSCIVITTPENVKAVADGVCEGVIATEPKGQNGFGYDPLFYVSKYKKTMAELPGEIKNRISHRAWALEKIKPFLQTLIKNLDK